MDTTASFSGSTATGEYAGVNADVALTGTKESLSASENQKWRIRTGFENGELLNWRFLFG